jgi:hypothetical protein
MILIKKADVENYLSARRKKTVFPFGLVSEPNATGDQPRDAKANASRSGSAVDASTVKKPQA